MPGDQPLSELLGTGELVIALPPPIPEPLGWDDDDESSDCGEDDDE